MNRTLSRKYNRINPTSSLRQGHHYQDLWVLKVLVDGLQNDDVQWVYAEAYPSEIEGRSGFVFDDILVAKSSGKYCLWQVKYRVDAEGDPWTWEELLKQDIKRKGGNRISILQDLCASALSEELEGRVEAFLFVTNGLADKEISSCLLDERMNLYAIEEQLPDTYARITEQLGDTESVQFFAKCRFHFGQKDIRELEEELSSFFYDDLKATKKGFDSLMLELTETLRQREPSKLDFSLIRTWCEFLDPNPLVEDFPIPEDFQYFDPEVHVRLLDELLTGKGGFKILTGEPGAGKSTYLSKLSEVLAERGTCCIKHHYYLSSDDPEFEERLRPNRAIEALKEAILRLPQEHLGACAHSNPGRVSMEEYLTQLSDYYSRQNKNFVLIIDGLDHEMRYRSGNALRIILDQLCFRLPNIWIVFGTQNNIQQYLPQIVLDSCPREKWITVTGLSRESTDAILFANSAGLSLPNNELLREDVASKLFEVTKGNPLILRYTLSRVKEKARGEPLGTHAFADIIPYSGSIQSYYELLWTKLSEESRLLLIYLSCLDLSISEGVLVEAALCLCSDYPRLRRGLDEVSFLLSPDRRRLSLYHTSFSFFVRDQPYYKENNVIVRQALIKWLARSKHDELKWYQLAKLEYHLGNSKPILSIDSPWFLDAIAHPRDWREISSQLNLSVKAALETEDFVKAFEASVMKDCLYNATKYFDKIGRRTWCLAYEINGESHNHLSLKALSDEQLYSIAVVACREGENEFVGAILEVLTDKHDRYSLSPKSQFGAEIPTLPKYTLRTVALTDSVDAERVLEYVRQFSRHGWSHDLLIDFTRALLDAGQIQVISDLLKKNLSKEERDTILMECCINDLSHIETKTIDLIKRSSSAGLGSFPSIYFSLHGQEIPSLPDLPQLDKLPNPPSDLAAPEEADVYSVALCDCFTAGLLYGIMDSGGKIESWIRQYTRFKPFDIITEMFQLGLEYSVGVTERGPLPIEELIKTIPETRMLLYQRGWRSVVYREAVRKAIKEIVLLMKSIEIGIFGKEFEPREIDVLDDEGLLSCFDMASVSVSHRVPVLGKDALDHIFKRCLGLLDSKVWPYHERAEHYLTLAELAHQYDDDRQRSMVRLAAQNSLGYGYHKDMAIFDVLHSIEICHSSGIKEANDWAIEIAPMVECIREYTDSDETRYIFPTYARLLYDVDKELLCAYYESSLEGYDSWKVGRIAEVIVERMEEDSDKGEKEILEYLGTARLESLKQKASMANEHQNATVEDPKEGAEVINYHSIKPSDLITRVCVDRLNRDEEKFLSGWAETWMSDESTRRDVYHEITRQIEDANKYDISPKFFDWLAQWGARLGDKKSFEFLCWAQANGHGWRSYWVDEREVEARWNVVLSIYPQRALEFLKRSMQLDGQNPYFSQRYYFGIPKAVQFLVLAGRLEDARTITKASVRHMHFLMADQRLPTPHWLCGRGD